MAWNRPLKVKRLCDNLQSDIAVLFLIPVYLLLIYMEVVLLKTVKNRPLCANNRQRHHSEDYSEIHVCLCETKPAMYKMKNIFHMLNIKRGLICHSGKEPVKAPDTNTGAYSYTSWLNLLSKLSVWM